MCSLNREQQCLTSCQQLMGPRDWPRVFLSSLSSDVTPPPPPSALVVTPTTRTTIIFEPEPCLICGNDKSKLSDKVRKEDGVYLRSLFSFLPDDDKEEEKVMTFCPNCLDWVRRLLRLREEMDETIARIRTVLRLRRQGLEYRSPTHPPCTPPEVDVVDDDDTEVVVTLLMEDYCDDGEDESDFGNVVEFDEDEDVEIKPKPLDDPAVPATISSQKNNKGFVCVTCGKEFKNKWRLKRHSNTTGHNNNNEGTEEFRGERTSEKPHICSYCPKRFLHKHLWRNHEMTHTGLRPFKCQEQDCRQKGVGFILAQELLRHMQTKHGGGGKTFVRQNGKILEKTEEVHKCSFCPKSTTFPARWMLQNHVRSVHTRPYICTSCGEGFPNPSSLIKHEKTHQKKKVNTYVCPVLNCGAVMTNSKTNTRRHNEAYHKDQDRFPCRLCSKGFPTGRRLHQHSILAHRKTYICSICGKGFGSPAFLKNHEENVHDPTPSILKPRPFPCLICHQGFRAKGQLKSHVENIHERRPKKEKTACEICGKLVRSLSYHNKVHREKKAHLCSFCPQLFRDMKTWRQHEMTHTGERPFKCEVEECGVRGVGFIQATPLVAHMKSIHGKTVRIKDGKAVEVAAEALDL